MTSMMKECMICLDEYIDFVTLPCEHELCTICYDNVMKASGKCPMCEAQLNGATMVTRRMHVGPYEDACCCRLLAFMGCMVTLTMCFMITNTLLAQQ